MRHYYFCEKMKNGKNHGKNKIWGQSMWKIMNISCEWEIVVYDLLFSVENDECWYRDVCETDYRIHNINNQK